MRFAGGIFGRLAGEWGMGSGEWGVGSGLILEWCLGFIIPVNQYKIVVVHFLVRTLL